MNTTISISTAIVFSTISAAFFLSSFQLFVVKYASLSCDESVMVWMITDSCITDVLGIVYLLAYLYRSSSSRFSGYLTILLSLLKIGWITYGIYIYIQFQGLIDEQIHILLYCIFSYGYFFSLFHLTVVIPLFLL